MSIAEPRKFVAQSLAIELISDLHEHLGSSSLIRFTLIILFSNCFCEGVGHIAGNGFSLIVFSDDITNLHSLLHLFTKKARFFFLSD